MAACSSSSPDPSLVRAAEAGVADSGTQVLATTQAILSSAADSTGSTLRAIVSQEVKDGLGGVVIPAGSDVLHSVEQLAPATPPARANGLLSLIVQSVTVNGRPEPVSADMHQVPHHLEWRTPPGSTGSAEAGYRDVVVSIGTPIVFTLAKSMKVTAR
jgi:hypothetical protein